MPLAQGEEKHARLVFRAVGAEGVQKPGPAPSDTSTAPPQTQAGKTQRTLGYVGLGVGEAGLLFGGITGIITAIKSSDLNSNVCAGNGCNTEPKSDVDSFTTLRTLSTVQQVSVDNADALAFKHPDASIVTILHNGGSAPAQTVLVAADKKVGFTVPAGGWATVNLAP